MFYRTAPRNVQNLVKREDYSPDNIVDIQPNGAQLVRNTSDGNIQISNALTPEHKIGERTINRNDKVACSQENVINQ